MKMIWNEIVETVKSIAEASGCVFDWIAKHCSN